MTVSNDRKMRLSALLALFFIFTASGPTLACDKETLQAKAAFAAADVIFLGKVENLQYLDDVDSIKTEPRTLVTFSIAESFKGNPENQITLHTTHNKWSCNGYRFKAGEEYLVYASRNRKNEGWLASLFAPEKPRIGVKVYAGTKPASEAGVELEHLRSR